MIHLYKRKLSSHKFVEVNDSTTPTTTTPNSDNISTTVSSTSTQAEDLDSEQLPSSQRSSVSSIIAIEVMTDTLSNLLRAQGGEIEVSTPTANYDTFDHGTTLFKVKSLDNNDHKEKKPSE
ncbi:20150_t:CDS:1, partial [Racocetra persica]